MDLLVALSSACSSHAVSRGRTVREFITCVLLIPTVVSAIWMTVFGGTGIDQVIELVTESGVYSYVVASYVPELSLFGMLADLPLASITSVLAIILVIVFFVTSSDSGSLRDRHDHRGRQDQRAGQPAVCSGCSSRASSRRCC